MASTMMTMLVVLASMFVMSFAQESVNAHEGFYVGKHAAIALLISFTILATFTITINIIKKKCVKVIP